MKLIVSSSAHCVSFICERDLERLHGFSDGLHCNKYILEDGRGEGPPVILCVAFSMNDPHLLDECAFSTLTCTCRDSPVIFK